MWLRHHSLPPLLSSYTNEGEGPMEEMAVGVAIGMEWARNYWLSKTLKDLLFLYKNMHSELIWMRRKLSKFNPKSPPRFKAGAIRIDRQEPDPFEISSVFYHLVFPGECRCVSNTMRMYTAHAQTYTSSFTIHSTLRMYFLASPLSQLCHVIISTSLGPRTGHGELRRAERNGKHSWWLDHSNYGCQHHNSTNILSSAFCILSTFSSINFPAILLWLCYCCIAFNDIIVALHGSLMAREEET